jgi:hypothetical protein
MPSERHLQVQDTPNKHNSTRRRKHFPTMRARETSRGGLDTGTSRLACALLLSRSSGAASSVSAANRERPTVEGARVTPVCSYHLPTQARLRLRRHRTCCFPAVVGSRAVPSSRGHNAMNMQQPSRRVPKLVRRLRHSRGSGLPHAGVGGRRNTTLRTHRLSRPTARKPTRRGQLSPRDSTKPARRRGR